MNNRHRSRRMETDSFNIRKLQVMAADALRRGQINDAKRLYQEICRRFPADVGAWHTLGILHAQSGALSEAEYCFAHLCEIAPGSVEAHYHLGLVYQHQRRNTAAFDCYVRALNLDSRNIDILNGIGTTLISLGKPEEAVKHLNRAVALEPGNSRSHYNLGLACHAMGAHETAITHYRQTVAFQPNNAEAHANLCAVYQHLDRLDEAAGQLKEALKLIPDNGTLHNALGVVLEKLGDTEGAAAHFTRAISLNPRDVSALFNLGNLKLAQNDPDGALACFEGVIAVDPQHAEALFCLGKALQAQGDYVQAIGRYERAIQSKPDFPQAHYNLGFNLLRLGDFARGWREFEWGLRSDNRAYRDFGFPVWDGFTPTDKNVLIIAEQGVGDEIMFASCIPDLIKVSGHCVIVCDRRLVPVFRRSFPTAGVYAAERDDNILQESVKIDAQISIASLPQHLRQSPERFPKDKQYLYADRQLAERWRRRLAMLDDNLKVGISWRGGTTTVRKNKRSIDLEHWMPILGIEGVTYVNLQYDKCADETSAMRREHGILLHDWGEIAPLEELEEFAALISSLDLVISVDNSTVHLSGALGVPTWALIPVQADWRWQLSRNDSPWYPSLRLFRQPHARGRVGTPWPDVR
jgi:tetratricopeptide (TPR) repeat protein